MDHIKYIQNINLNVEKLCPVWTVQGQGYLDNTSQETYPDSFNYSFSQSAFNIFNAYKKDQLKHCFIPVKYGFTTNSSCSLW